MVEDWRRRARRLMEEKNLDMRTLSRRAGLGDTYVRDALKRGRGGSVEKMERIARVLGTSVDFLMRGVAPESASVTVPVSGIVDQTNIKVLGDVAAGVWLENVMALAVEDAPDSVFPPDPRYPIEAQYDLNVRGSSLNRVARDGDMLRCVDIVRAGIEPREGDLVIVKRTRGQLVELTAKRVRRRPGGPIELHPDSTDPRWQEPLRLGYGEDEVQIIALALYSYVPLTR